MSSREKFFEILGSVFNVDVSELPDSTGPTDLEEWNSSTHMELVAEFNDIFDVILNAWEITEMDNIGNMMKVLRRHGVDL